MRQTPPRRLPGLRASCARDVAEITRDGVLEHLDLGMSMTIHVSGSKNLPDDCKTAGNDADGSDTEH